MYSWCVCVCACVCHIFALACPHVLVFVHVLVLTRCVCVYVLCKYNLLHLMVTISKFEWWPLQRMAQRWVGEVKHLVFPPTPTTCPLGPTDHLGLEHLALFILPAPTFLTSPFCKHSLQFTVLPDASRCSPSYDGPSPFPPIRAPSVSTTLCRSYTGHHSHWWLDWFDGGSPCPWTPSICVLTRCTTEPCDIPTDLLPSHYCNCAAPRCG